MSQVCLDYTLVAEQNNDDGADSFHLGGYPGL